MKTTTRSPGRSYRPPMLRNLAKWLLPQSADVLGMLCDQAEITHRGMAAFAEWAAGDSDAGTEVRALEHVADEKKGELVQALVDAFSTPIDSQDIFTLSHDLDMILDLAKDTVRETTLLRVEPDDDSAEMAVLLRDGVGHLVSALANLHDVGATAHADEARRCARAIEKAYRHAVDHAFDEEDVRVLMSRRELYRQFGRIAEFVIEVAERIKYVIVKEA